MQNKIRMNLVITEEVSTLLHTQEDMSETVNKAVLQFFNKTDDKTKLNEMAKGHIVEIEKHKCELIDIMSKIDKIIVDGTRQEREEAEKQKKELDEHLRKRKVSTIHCLKPQFLALKANKPFFDKCFGDGLLLQDREWTDLAQMALEMNEAKVHTLKFDAFTLWRIGKNFDDLKDLEPEEVLKETNEEE